MQRFTFDDEDESINKMTRARHIPHNQEQEKEVVEVRKTKVKHKKSHSLPKRSKTKVKYKDKTSPVMKFIKTFLLITLFIIVVVAIAFGVRYYLDNPEQVREWIWQAYRYLFR